VVTHTRKVLHTASADKHDAVLLEVVAFARDVCVDLFGVGKTYAGNLTHCGVRFLRCGCVHTQAYATLLRTGIKGAGFALFDDHLAALAD